MERPFFLTLDGLWFGLLLIAGHGLGYVLVAFTRRMGWNDFSAILLMSLGLCIAGVMGIFMGLWYVHSLGFGLFMGTIVFLAMSGGETGNRENDEGAR